MFRIDPKEEDQLFVATCFTSKDTCEHWLVDSRYTNHMTYDRELFKELRSITNKMIKQKDKRTKSKK